MSKSLAKPQKTVNPKSTESRAISKLDRLNFCRGDKDAKRILSKLPTTNDKVAMREYMEKSVFVSPNCCIIIDGALVIKQKTMPYKSPLAMPIETTFIIVLLIRATVSLKTFSVAGGMY